MILPHTYAYADTMFFYHLHTSSQLPTTPPRVIDDARCPVLIRYRDLPDARGTGRHISEKRHALHRAISCMPEPSAAECVLAEELDLLHTTTRTSMS